MPKTANCIFMGLPIFGVIWAGGFLIVSFLLLFDMTKKPQLALLCTFGATAAFLKIMSCGFLLRAIRRCNTSECRTWLGVNTFLTVTIELLDLPVYFLNSSIWTPTNAAATIISAAYSCCLLIFIFLQPPCGDESSISLIEASETD